MEHHGSESYFVVGEGLLTESVGGRERTLSAGLEALAPPFRFSRMGPNGIQHQLGEPNLKKIANAMTASGVGASQIPVRLHVPRPVHGPRSDLRQDQGHAR